ncbi:MAG: penicillin acylase family protein [Planctomycetes bacterium]|nr:penicillin acylase family protein [Planctomycetota bacterium]
MERLPRAVEAGLDEHGVYTVAGRDPAAVARTLGRLQALNHTIGLFTALAAAAGRLAACLGPARPDLPARRLDADPRVRSDLAARRFRFRAHGRRILHGLAPVLRAWIEGFAAGVEEARLELRGRAAAFSPEFLRLLSFPITADLVTALDYRVAAHHELVRLRHPAAPIAASNAVAVGGRRARGGGGLLLIDPHIPFLATPELRLLAARIRTAGYEAAGWVRLGSPLIFLGFSRHLAWTVTTNWPDTLRFYRLRARGAHYVDLTSGRRLQRIDRAVAIAVAGRPTRRFRLTFAGRLDRPVLRGLPGGGALAVELAAAAARAGDLTTQLHTAACVRTARAFRRRVLAVAGATLTNFVVADRDGGIGCYWHGHVPAAGGGYLDPVRELPADDGGRGGLVVQNNAHFDRVRPGGPLGLADFPLRVAAGRVSLSSFRQERTLRRLAGLRRIGLKDLLALALDTHDLRGALFVRRMAAAIAASAAIRRWAAPRRRQLAQALAETARWNRRLDAGSRRATLVQLWMELVFWRQPPLEGSFQRPETVPGRLPARLAVGGARALLEAIARWRKAGRPAWGSVHRLALGGACLPVGGSLHVNRAAGWLSPPDLDPATLDFPVEIGSAGVLAVHLRPGHIEARFLKVLGPVEDPASPLFVLTARDWAAGRARPLALRPPRALEPSVCGP